MADNDKPTIVMSPEFRAAFVKVFEPKDTKQGPRYVLTAIFPEGADLSELKRIAVEALVKRWGADKTKWPSKVRNNPFKDAGEKAGEYDGFEKGMVYIETMSKFPPRIVDQNVQQIINPKDFYSGCYARATLNAYTYDTDGNKGVSFGLNDIQKTRDGKPFAGRPDVKDVFKPVEGAAAPAAAAGDSFLD